MQDEYVDDYEGELDIEDAGYLEEYTDEDDSFDESYDTIFGDSGADDEDYELDAVTGRRSKRPKMSILNKVQVSKHELDELFLE